MPELDCPHCREKLAVKKMPAAGATVRCYQCQQPFVVPERPPELHCPHCHGTMTVKRSPSPGFTVRCYLCEQTFVVGQPATTSPAAPPAARPPAAKPAPPKASPPPPRPSPPPAEPDLVPLDNPLALQADPYGLYGAPLAADPLATLPAVPRTQQAPAFPLQYVIMGGAAVVGVFIVGIAAVGFILSRSQPQTQAATNPPAATPQTGTPSPAAPPAAPKSDAKLLYRLQPGQSLTYLVSMSVTGPIVAEFRVPVTVGVHEVTDAAKAYTGGLSAADLKKARFLVIETGGGGPFPGRRSQAILTETGRFIDVTPDRAMQAGFSFSHMIFDELPTGNSLSWVTGGDSRWNFSRRSEMPIMNVTGEGAQRRLNETLVSIGHRMACSRGKREGDLLTINKRYDADQINTPNGTAQAKGTGISVFDLANGRPQRGEISAEVMQVVRGEQRPMKVELKYELAQ